MLALAMSLAADATQVRPGVDIVRLVELQVSFTPDPLPIGQMGEITVVGCECQWLFCSGFIGWSPAGGIPRASPESIVAEAL